VSRRPGLAIELGEHRGADRRVALRARLDLAGERRERVQQIGAADDADELRARMTGTRLTRRFSISATTSSSAVSSPTVSTCAVITSSMRRAWVWT
jgi:hypothetical protein